MASEKETKDAYNISDEYEAVNVLFITLLAEQVGGLTSASNAIEQSAITKKNIDKIKKKMAKAYKTSVKEVNKMLVKYGLDKYESMEAYYKARGLKQIPFKKNAEMIRQLNAVAKVTEGTMRNLSNTTVIDMAYRNAVDRSIIAVQSGSETYQQAIDHIMRQAVDKGSKVSYGSGYSRRLDSAVRQNVLDGVRNLNRAINHECAQEFGADGVLIHPHGLCAEDHLEYQGKKYTMEEFEQIQSDLERPFGEWNCQHEVEEIIYDVSSNPYTEEQLEEIAETSTEEIDLGNGRTATRYECSQKMRQQETRIRDSKCQYIQAKTRFEASGGTQGEAEMRRFKRKIKRQEDQYNAIADKAGLTPRPYRAKVTGFKY